MTLEIKVQPPVSTWNSCRNLRLWPTRPETKVNGSRRQTPLACFTATTGRNLFHNDHVPRDSGFNRFMSLYNFYRLSWWTCTFSPSWGFSSFIFGNASDPLLLQLCLESTSCCGGSELGIAALHILSCSVAEVCFLHPHLITWTTRLISHHHCY